MLYLNSNECCPEGDCPSQQCGSCGCEDLPCVSLTNESTARCAATVARDANGDPEIDPSTGECVYEVDCNDPSHNGPYPKSSLVEEYDCCDELNNKYYDWWQGTRFDEMYLYSTRCSPCPIGTSWNGDPSCFPCAAAYNNPVTLIWDSVLCGYRDESFQFLYGNFSDSAYQPANYFSFYINGAEQVQPYQSQGTERDDVFIDPSYANGNWWEYDSGGHTLVFISGRATDHIDMWKMPPENNAMGKNIHVQCPAAC